jgi:UDP-N-acetylmuramoyl-L-alanyl-D-glutamate--2,6-diaminopimelate ligase
LENLLVAFGALVALGFERQAALDALAGAPPVPGRLERCDAPEDELVVVVDYAHTPDALERVLIALRPLTRGKLWCVFGCGGDRDAGKRPKMGGAVARLADAAVITNDNPRTEPPEQIARAIAQGFEGSALEPIVELDRAAAIELAIRRAAPGDTVLIAGKGHEDYQIFGTERRSFDDRQEARTALARRRGGGHP